MSAPYAPMGDPEFMPAREWTGSVAVLPDSMAAFAVEMANLGRSRNAPMDESDAREMAEFLADHAYTLSEWSDAVRELYVRLDEGERVTNAQGVRLARLLRGAREITVRTDSILVPDGWLHFTLTYADGRTITGGIEPDGSSNT